MLDGVFKFLKRPTPFVVNEDAGDLRVQSLSELAQHAPPGTHLAAPAPLGILVRGEIVIDIGYLRSVTFFWRTARTFCTPRTLTKRSWRARILGFPKMDVVNSSTSALIGADTSTSPYSAMGK